MQNCLDLIVPCVCHGDHPTVMSPSHLGQSLVAMLACHFLGNGPIQVHPHNLVHQSQRVGQRPHPLAIRLRFPAPEPMVHMTDDDPDLRNSVCGDHSPEQSHAVSATGDPRQAPWNNPPRVLATSRQYAPTAFDRMPRNPDMIRALCKLNGSTACSGVPSEPLTGRRPVVG